MNRITNGETVTRTIGEAHEARRQPARESVGAAIPFFKCSCDGDIVDDGTAFDDLGCPI